MCIFAAHAICSLAPAQVPVPSPSNVRTSMHTCFWLLSPTGLDRVRPSRVAPILTAPLASLARCPWVYVCVCVSCRLFAVSSRVVALLPQEEVVVDGAQIEPGGFNAVVLPFADEVREPKAAPAPAAENGSGVKVEGTGTDAGSILR